MCVSLCVYESVRVCVCVVCMRVCRRREEEEREKRGKERNEREEKGDFSVFMKYVRMSITKKVFDICECACAETANACRGVIFSAG